MMLLYWCFSSYTELQIVNCFSFFSFFKIKLSLFLSMNYLICCFVLYWDRIGFSIYFKRKWENTWIFFSFFIVDGSLWNSHLFDLTRFIDWIVLLDLLSSWVEIHICSIFSEMGISIADFESVHVYSTSQELISICWLRIHLHYQRNSENGSEEERILGWSFTYSLFSSCSIGLARGAYTSILIVDVFKIICLWLVFSDYSTSNSLFHFRHP